MTKALLPGSFDPVTTGHVDIISRASKLFDELIVVLCVNSEKHAMFTPAQREELLRIACEPFTNVRVEVCTGQLFAAYAAGVGAHMIVKGVRDSTDFEYEMTIAEVNRTQSDGLDTIFIPTLPALRHVSSTVAREMIRYGGELGESGLKTLSCQKRYAP